MKQYPASFSFVIHYEEVGSWHQTIFSISSSSVIRDLLKLTLVRNLYLTTNHTSFSNKVNKTSAMIVFCTLLRGRSGRYGFYIAILSRTRTSRFVFYFKTDFVLGRHISTCHFWLNVLYVLFSCNDFKILMPSSFIFPINV